MNTRTFCVGLTGGVGSGKSTVADCFAQQGVPVIDTDVIAHELTAPEGAAIPAIVSAFGTGVTTPAGALDRTAMRDRVFSDPGARKTLESILHPLIRTESLHRIDAVSGGYALLVVPLLVENLPAYRSVLHRIAVVDCDEMQQILRTAARPGLNIEQAKWILAAQASAASRIQIADDLIDNRRDLAHLEQQVQRLHALYLKLAARLSGTH